MPRGKPVPFPPPVGGLRADMPEWMMPMSTIADGSNVVIRDGKLYIRSGFVQADATGFGEQVMGGIFYKTAAGAKKTVAAGLTTRKQFTAGAWAAITGTSWTGTADNHARFVDFPKDSTIYIIGVNGKDATVEWDGAAATDSDLTGGAPIAKDVTSAANRIIYGHCTVGANVYPYAFMYSAFNNHQSTPAGNLVHVAEGAGQIVAVRNLGVESFAIYTEKGQFVATAQGGTAPFRVDYRSGQPGPVSPAAVVLGGDGAHYYLGTDSNFYRFDGTPAKVIGNFVRSKVYASLDANLRYRAHGFFDIAHREVTWFWPPIGGGTVTAGISLNVDTNVWSSLYSLNYPVSSSWNWDDQTSLTWAGLSGTWATLGATYPTWLSMQRASNPTVMLGAEGGQTYIYGNTGNDNGTAISAWWAYPAKALSGDGKLSGIDAVESAYKQLTTSMNLSFRLGIADYAAGPVTLQDAQTFDMSGTTLPQAEYENLHGRFQQLKYIVTDTDQGMEFLGGIAYVFDRGVAA